MIDKIKKIVEKDKNILEFDYRSAQDQINNKLHRIAVIINYDHKKAVFRMVIQETDWAHINYENELSALIALMKTGSPYCPKVYNYKKDELWTIESFVEGRSGGNSFNLDNEFIKNVNAGDLIKILKKLKNIEPDLLSWPENIIDYYGSRYKAFEKFWPEKTNAHLKTWISLYNNKYKKYLVENKKFSHGDVNGGNLIINNGKFVGLIDWETCRYDFYLRDFACVYAAARGYDKWRESFLAKLRLDENDRNIFFFLVYFYLAENITNLNRMIIEKKEVFFRSGKMSRSEIESNINNNLLEINNLLYKGELK